MSLSQLQGPILVLGASGFVGANLIKKIFSERQDVFGTTSQSDAWRINEFSLREKVVTCNLRNSSSLYELIEKIQPKTIFNLAAYGAYPFETEHDLIYETNFKIPLQILEYLDKKRTSIYIHAGSSSEYGENAAGPSEADFALPNSHYAVSKLSCANLISFYGKKRGVPAANLRLYSVYGPFEEPSRLIPNLVKNALNRRFPEFVHGDISRDFIYIDDVCDAFVAAALNLTPSNYGESFNIGTGVKTSIKELAFLTKELFSVEESPVFNATEQRNWDLCDWYANIEKAKTILKWCPCISLSEGLIKTAEWLSCVDKSIYFETQSKKFLLDKQFSISIIVACYKDAKAIPYMYQRLTNVLQKERIDYEIIFVNDGSPDESENVISEISSKDLRVVGVTHSRNFGSQSAFFSGMSLSRKNSCVLMDGDLQDPPEIIPSFIAKWRDGYEVIYGVRTSREAPFYMQIAYKLFYRIFSYFSYINIPKDAGDFSLIDRRVVNWILRFPERDLFLRGVRAYAGFRQIGVPYFRPERLFGRSTNNLLKNFGWAKKGFLSFSYVPLNILTFCSVVLFLISFIASSTAVFIKLAYPESAPRGITTLMLMMFFFGSVILLFVALIGEYIAKIFEEVKARPKYIRKSFIENGVIKKLD